jgi:hypothetical protein
VAAIDAADSRTLHAAIRQFARRSGAGLEALMGSRCEGPVGQHSHRSQSLPFGLASRESVGCRMAVGGTAAGSPRDNPRAACAPTPATDGFDVASPRVGAHSRRRGVDAGRRSLALADARQTPSRGERPATGRRSRTSSDRVTLAHVPTRAPCRTDRHSSGLLIALDGRAAPGTYGTTD